MNSSEYAVYKRKISDFIQEHYAIRTTDMNLHSLDYFILTRLKVLGKPISEYYDYLLQNYHENGEEIRLFLDEITVQETYFFRDQGQFQALIEYVLPALIEQKRNRDESLRIWSAGCSTGEEPYTIAIILNEYFQNILDWNILIRATDVNMVALQKAKKGVYRKHSFRGVSESIKSKYFFSEGNSYFLKESIKTMVSFDYFNLASDTFLPVGRGNTWDIIFCRNVLIYFHKERIRSLLKRFHRALHEKGFLFLGFSENIFSYSRDFESVHYENSFFYKKKFPGKKPVREPNLRKSYPERAKGRATGHEGGRLTHRESRKGKKTFDEQLEVIKGLFSLEKYEQAHRMMSEIRIVPPEKEIEYLFLKARISSNLSKLDEANHAINLILSKNALDKEAYFLKALILFRSNNVNGSIENFKKVLYVDPDYVLARLYLGDLYRMKDRFKLAQREYQNALITLEKNLQIDLGPFAAGFSSEILAQTFINKIKSLEKSHETYGNRRMAVSGR
ncbi:MAG: hypothetical protein GXO76_14540 [Calditrichaeota bacterium]|nr:hypothetical protein [Calditrichota bacterium]